MKLRVRRLSIVALPLVAVLTGCSDDPSPPPAPPAKAEAVAHESDLLKLTLTAQAQQRLGIRTVKIGDGSASEVRETSGEVVVPATGAAGVPTGSTTNLAQIGASQVAAEGEVARAQAQVRLAVIAYNRADALVREEAGSVRARDEAAAALATAQAALDAARAQRVLLGPSIASMGDLSTLWVRVPVFGTDVSAVERGRAATVGPLGDDRAAPRSARPVQAPPSANAVAGTVDLFFALDNRDRAYRVGQRVAVALPLGGRADGLSIPAAAIVRDIYGGEWVYRKTAPDTYVRQRIEVANVREGRALLSRGLERGAEVVTDGAAELFGTEFGTPH
jgi:multidrug efflux system membrane fusion protein